MMDFTTLDASEISKALDSIKSTKRPPGRPKKNQPTVERKFEGLVKIPEDIMAEMVLNNLPTMKRLLGLYNSITGDPMICQFYPTFFKMYSQSKNSVVVTETTIQSSGILKYGVNIPAGQSYIENGICSNYFEPIIKKIDKSFSTLNWIRSHDLSTTNIVLEYAQHPGTVDINDLKHAVSYPPVENVHYFNDEDKYPVHITMPYELFKKFVSNANECKSRLMVRKLPESPFTFYNEPKNEGFRSSTPLNVDGKDSSIVVHCPPELQSFATEVDADNLTAFMAFPGIATIDIFLCEQRPWLVKIELDKAILMRTLVKRSN